MIVCNLNQDVPNFVRGRNERKKCEPTLLDPSVHGFINRIFGSVYDILCPSAMGYSRVVREYYVSKTTFFQVLIKK